MDKPPELIFLTKSTVRTVPVGVISELIRGDVFYWGQLMAAGALDLVRFPPNLLTKQHGHGGKAG
jgi:hypothetical protein